MFGLATCGVRLQCILISGLLLIPSASGLAAVAQSSPPTSAMTAEQRIQRIENAILPAVMIAGAATPTTTLAERMKALHVPGVSVAFIRDGKIEWARGFGVTKLGGPAVTPQTMFQAGSISKPVAATAVLRLVQLGKLDLDTDVNQYLKSWKIPANAFTEKTKITLRELLTHTAGMTVHGFAGYTSDASVPTLVEVLDGLKPANSPPILVDTAPGTIWRYSGGGYVVAQQLLDDMTGIPFEELMHDTVLGPIGMTRSTYEQPLPKNRFAEAATPYRDSGEPVRGGPHTYPEMAPAGLWTTPSDLARFAMEIQQSLAGKSNHVLSVGMTHQMLTSGLGGWGLGLQIGGSAEHPYFTHGGADDGFLSNLVAYNEGDGVVIMTNGDNGGELALELQRTIAHEYGWPDFQPKERHIAQVSPKLFEGYVGHYKLANGTIRVVTRKADQLFYRRVGTPTFRLLPEGDHDYFLTDADAQFTFDVDANGRAIRLITHQNGLDTVASRIGDTDTLAVWTDTVLQRIDQQVQMPGSEVALRRIIDELRRGQPSYDQMTPGFASFTRQQLTQLETAMSDLGSLESVLFKGVGPAGRDIYEVKFANGWTNWRVGLTPDGKVEFAGFRPD